MEQIDIDLEKRKFQLLADLISAKDTGLQFATKFLNFAFDEAHIRFEHLAEKLRIWICDVVSPETTDARLKAIFTETKMDSIDLTSGTMFTCAVNYLTQARLKMGPDHTDTSTTCAPWLRSLLYSCCAGEIWINKALYELALKWGYLTQQEFDQIMTLI